MAQSLARILVHMVFSTRNRVPLIGPGIEPELHSYLATALRSCESPALMVGGAEDHVHILCSLSRNRSVSQVLKEVKEDSSKWIKTKSDQLATFYWQGGYGAFSIGESGVPAVTQYITNQKQHHRKVSFQDELRALLRKYNVKFDERYLWD